MTSAVRVFMLDENGGLFRLPTARYLRMVREPAANPLESLANRHVRCAEAVVELKSRKAVRVTRVSFWTVLFDHRGVLDTALLGRQCVATVDALLDRAWPREHPGKVVDAALRFVANGGTWTPTSAQRIEIGRAALGKSGCVVLRREGVARRAGQRELNARAAPPPIHRARHRR